MEQSLNSWWPGQPVLNVQVQGTIANRDQAYTLAQSMVGALEASAYAHVIVILDLTALGGSPSAAILLGGNLPPTNRIEHLVLINAPGMFRMAALGMIHLRNKLHFVGNAADAKRKATELLARLE
ncbi:MAG: hypothetical protein ACYDBJ_22245 [Aggregatilineales bacterium]